MEVVARDFRVINSRGEMLFGANRQEVIVGADILRVSGIHMERHLAVDQKTKSCHF